MLICCRGSIPHDPPKIARNDLYIDHHARTRYIHFCMAKTTKSECQARAVRPVKPDACQSAGGICSVFYLLLRDQCKLSQVVIVECALSVGSLIQSERSGNFDFERTGVDQTVDLVEGWRVILAVVVIECNAGTFFGHRLDTGGIGDASTRFVGRLKIFQLLHHPSLGARHQDPRVRT